MEVTVIKSNRKTVAIQVNSDLSVTLRVPRQATQRDIQKILKEKETWILKHIEEIKQKKAAFDASAPERLTNDEIHELADKALKYIPERVAYFAKQIGVSISAVRTWEQGVSNPSLKAQKKIVDFCKKNGIAV